MGNILSSSTVYANAYLTKKGREYLFNQNNNRFLTDTSTGTLIDLMKITHFSLSDPDVNYKITGALLLESGDVPDISGRNEGCIKSTLVSQEKNLISYDGNIGSSNASNSDFLIDYGTNLTNDTLIININVSNLPNPLINKI